MPYVTTKTLDPTVQRALAQVGFARKDISVEARETVSAIGAGGDGTREFLILVNLGANTFDLQWGSWGGSNAFVRNQVDSDSTPRPMPENGVVIKGHVGGGRPVYAYILCHSNMLPKMLPAPAAELADDEKEALYCLKSLKSGYRQDHYSNRRYGKPDWRPWEDVVRALVSKGMATTNRAGAVSITTEGKNAAPSRY